MRHEAELAADDAVLTAGARPTQYAEDLIAFARRNSVPALGLPLSRPTGLNVRIRRIVREGVNRRAITRRRVVATASVGVLAAASFASMRFVAQVEPEGVMAAVSQRVTEAMTASGKRSVEKASSGQVVLVFARDVRKGAVSWTIETQVDEIKGATPGSMSQFLERRADKSTDRLYHSMVVTLKKEVGVIDVTFQTEDGAMKVLADEKVANGKSDGPLNLHPLPLTSQTIAYDPKGPRNFAEMRAPKMPAGQWVSLELYDRSGKPAMVRLSAAVAVGIGSSTRTPRSPTSRGSRRRPQAKGDQRPGSGTGLLGIQSLGSPGVEGGAPIGAGERDASSAQSPSEGGLAIPNGVSRMGGLAFATGVPENRQGDGLSNFGLESRGSRSVESSERAPMSRSRSAGGERFEQSVLNAETAGPSTSGIVAQGIPVGELDIDQVPVARLVEASAGQSRHGYPKRWPNWPCRFAREPRIRRSRCSEGICRPALAGQSPFESRRRRNAVGQIGKTWRSSAWSAQTKPRS
ncbi:hypothetical protein U1Q18_052116 [Sarracenia purpurea var. burkii]